MGHSDRSSFRKINKRVIPKITKSSRKQQKEKVTPKQYKKSGHLTATFGLVELLLLTTLVISSAVFFSEIDAFNTHDSTAEEKVKANSAFKYSCVSGVFALSALFLGGYWAKRVHDLDNLKSKPTTAITQRQQDAIDQEIHREDRNVDLIAFVLVVLSAFAVGFREAAVGFRALPHSAA